MQQNWGQQPPFGNPMQPAPKRSVVLTVIGLLFAALAVLLALAGAVGMTQSAPTGAGAAYQFGRIIGVVFIVGIPALIAYLCLTAHTRKAKKMGRR